MAFVYIVRCADGTFYTGMATDVERRVQQHNSGRGAKYTRGRRPVELVYCEERETVGKALRREKEIQKMNRHKKSELIKSKKQANSHPADKGRMGISDSEI
ncbi:MAG: GIY-YIG nuclease family protein [candidate division KSB1 bacterium]|nr:GIY-YIG nuclease family protein [candidate division KSB1 bacterium]